jgi:hypothetical protein
LQVSVDGKLLAHGELLVLTERLQQEQKRLAEGRSRYKEMEMQYQFLQHPDPEIDVSTLGDATS